MLDSPALAAPRGASLALAAGTGRWGLEESPLAAALAAGAGSSDFFDREAAADEVVQHVTCRIVVPYHKTRPGQQVHVFGNVPELGEWHLERAVPLDWQEGHSHVGYIKLPAGQPVQLKVGRRCVAGGCTGDGRVER
jgi:hypothetical protein